MSVEQNKRLVRAYIEEAINRRDLSNLDKRVADTYVGHGFVTDRGELRQFLEWQARTAPDWSIVIENMVGEAGRVAVRAIATGIRTEQLPGIPYPSPVRRRVEWITTYRIEGARLAESWVVSDGRTVDD